MSRRPPVTEPGVYAMPFADYLADPAPEPSLSSTGARQLVAECPARYWHDRNHPRPPTDALVLGSAAHEWLLEGETWPQRHFVLPDLHDARTKDGRDRLAAIAKDGLRPIKAVDFEAIKAMREALAAHDFARSAFRHGRAETAMFWRDAIFDVWCRGRLDFLPYSGRVFPDYKTCASAQPDAIRRSIASYGYHQQAAWYVDGIRALGVCDDPIFLFVFQEKAPPYLVTCVALDEDALGWGRQLNERAKGTFRRCLSTGRWPGYADDILTLGLPAWERQRLERLSEAGGLDGVQAMHADPEMEPA
jgi:hypothetical protein